jgi:hypothetical protein
MKTVKMVDGAVHTHGDERGNVKRYVGGGVDGRKAGEGDVLELPDDLAEFVVNERKKATFVVGEAKAAPVDPKKN